MSMPPESFRENLRECLQVFANCTLVKHHQVAFYHDQNPATLSASASERAKPACAARRPPQSLPPSPAMPATSAVRNVRNEI